MSTSLVSRSCRTAECTSRRELLRFNLSCRDSRPSARRKRPGCPIYWRLLVQSDLSATPARCHPLHRQAAGERAGEVQLDFDKGVASVNRNLKAGDQAFLASAARRLSRLSSQTPDDLDWKTVGPYTVLANDVSTIVLDVDGLAERINSNRIRPAL